MWDWSMLCERKLGTLWGKCSQRARWCGRDGGGAIGSNGKEESVTMEEEGQCFTCGVWK
jgi:hypothetical protein